MKSDKKLFVFDIDGTLLPEGGELPQSSIDAINLIHEHGDIACLATGRAYVQTIDIAKKLGIKKHLICAAGATVARMDLGTIDVRSTIPKPIFDYFIELAKKTKRQLNIKLVNGAIKYYFGEDVKKDINKDSIFWSRGGTLNPVYDDFSKLEQDVKLEEVIAISIKAEPEIVKKHFHEVKNDLSNIDDNFTAVVVSDVYLEAYKKGVNKSVAIQAIVNEENIAYQNVYVFGDSSNDLEMIIYFEHGIAMGNATSDVKQIANEVIDSCENDGVYKYIKKLYQN